ncbi:MAG: DUF2085 domain-containing protein [Thermoplasmatales archaeon]|nr:DUF2085 domain-containing protein [Thermoplasmatales archaeon]
MDKKTNEKESVVKIILEFIQHNPRHYIKLDIFGKTICPCARCFGFWIGLLVGFILSIPIWLGLFQIQNFILIFILAWLFTVPVIVDWSSVRLGLRVGKNSVRVSTGFLHGIGVIIYFFVLPAGIIFKVLTYFSYEIIFYVIRWRYHIQHYNMKL